MCPGLAPRKSGNFDFAYFFGGLRTYFFQKNYAVIGGPALFSILTRVHFMTCQISNLTVTRHKVVLTAIKRHKVS